MSAIEDTRTAERQGRVEFIAGLRELADYLEQRPEIPTPNYGVDLGAFVFGDDAKGEMARAARAMGKAEKEMGDGGYFRLRAPTFRGNIRFYVVAERERVCERVQVGTTTREIPDPERIAEVPTVTVEEPVYEWRCEPSILRAGA